MRVLALDYGSARCGVALSDPTGTLATPVDPVARPATRRGMAALLGLVQEHAIERVVVGLPLSLSGIDSAQTAETRSFAATLARRLGDGVAVELWDERFTTRLAQRDTQNPADSRATERRGNAASQHRRVSRGARGSEDSRAAAYLLESWLARPRPSRAGGETPGPLGGRGDPG